MHLLSGIGSGSRSKGRTGTTAETAAEEAKAKYIAAQTAVDQSQAYIEQLRLDQEIITAKLQRIKEKNQSNLAAAKANLAFHQLTAEE